MTPTPKTELSIRTRDRDGCILDMEAQYGRS
jgi:hypothetical protein